MLSGLTTGIGAVLLLAIYYAATGKRRRGESPPFPTTIYRAFVWALVVASITGLLVPLGDALVGSPYIIDPTWIIGDAIGLFVTCGLMQMFFVKTKSAVSPDTPVKEKALPKIEPSHSSVVTPQESGLPLVNIPKMDGVEPLPGNTEDPPLYRSSSTTS